MKKLKLLSFAVLPLALGFLASCGENTDAKVTVNSGNAQVMKKLDKEEGADYEELFKIENLNLEAGDSLTFTYKGNDVSEKVIPEIVLPGNNLDEDLKIVNDADAAFITLKVYKDDVYSAFVSGFETPEPPEPDTINVSYETPTNGELKLNQFGEVDLGSTITVTATPNEGYSLKEIKLNGEVASTTSPYDFIVSEELADDEDKIVVSATFETYVPPVNPHKVSETEWVAAFGQSKPFYIDDNYRLDVENIMGGFTSNGSLIADSNKLKSIDPEETYYFEIVDSQKYQYSQDKATKKWSKAKTTATAADDVAPYFTMFAVNYSKFQFDETDNTYKCDALTYSGAEFKNLKIKFENKKILTTSCDTKMPVSTTQLVDASMKFSFIYGGQSVELPHVDPEPEPEELKIDGAQELVVDEAITLTASALPAGATLKDEVTWSINAGQEYVTLSATTGTSIDVIGLLQGTAEIKAVCGTLPAVYHTVEVKEPLPPSTFQMLLNGEPVNLSHSEYPPEGYDEWFVKDQAVQANTIIGFVNNGEVPPVEFNVTGIEEISPAKDAFKMEHGTLVCKATGTFDIYLKLKEGQDIVYIEGNFEPVVTTDYGVVVNGNFSKLGSDGNKTYKVDTDMAKDMVVGVASKTNGTVTNLPVPKSGLTYDETKFDFNEQDSTLTVKESGHYYFSIRFENGEVVELKQTNTPSKATVTITINYKTQEGQAVYIVGNFNNWSPNVNAIRGNWTEGNDWVFEITQPVNTVVEFKFIINNYDEPADQAIKWEGDPNRTYTFTTDESVTLNWQN